MAMGWWSTNSNDRSPMAPPTCCSNPTISSLASPRWGLARGAHLVRYQRSVRTQRPAPSPHCDPQTFCP